MCGLYALFGPHARHCQDYGVDAWPDFADRYKIVPSSSAPVLRQSPDGRRVVDLLRWGLIPHWAKEPAIGRQLINARGETIAEKPSFRSAFRQRRCIVPASGFYEWQAVSGRKRKQPWFIRHEGGGPMAMAGLWESWRAPDGEVVRSFCIVTTAANEVVAPIHERMPVILASRDWSAWLDPATNVGAIAPLVGPAPAGAIEAWPLAHPLNATQEDDPEVLAPRDHG